METTAQSGDSDIAEELLRFFVEQKEKECFAAMLYTCYEFIKPDVALEVRRAPSPEPSRTSGAALLSGPTAMALLCVIWCPCSMTPRRG